MLISAKLWVLLTLQTLKWGNVSTNCVPTVVVKNSRTPLLKIIIIGNATICVLSTAKTCRISNCPIHKNSKY